MNVWDEFTEKLTMCVAVRRGGLLYVQCGTGDDTAGLSELEGYSLGFCHWW